MKLGPEARMLVAGGRKADRPTSADRERVLSKLCQRIALPVPSLAGVAVHAEPPSPPEVPPSATYSRELLHAARR